MKLFNTLTKAQFNAADKQFTGESAEADYQLYCDYLAARFEMYATSQDSSHLNKILDAARFRGMYRDIKSVIDQFSAYKWSKAKGYHGTANKGILAAMHNINDDGVLVWEQALFDALAKVSAKQAEREEKQAAKFNPEAKFDAFFKSCGKNGMTLDQVRELFEVKFAEYSKSMLKDAA